MEPWTTGSHQEHEGLRILHTDQNAPCSITMKRWKSSTPAWIRAATHRTGRWRKRKLYGKITEILLKNLLMIVGRRHWLCWWVLSAISTLKKIGKLAKALDIDDLEYLQKLDEKRTLSLCEAIISWLNSISAYVNKAIPDETWNGFFMRTASIKLHDLHIMNQDSFQQLSWFIICKKIMQLCEAVRQSHSGFHPKWLFCWTYAEINMDT